MLPYEYETASPQRRFLSYIVNDLNWYTHFHESFEICYVISGEMTISIDSTAYHLKRHDSVIIFPRQLHSYDTPSHSDMRIISFSPELIPTFYEKYLGYVPQNSFLSDISEYKDEFESDNVFVQKGMLYSILGAMVENTIFDEWQSNADTSLIRRVIKYIEDHHSGVCTLRSASAELSYGYSYLSRVFSGFMGMSFTEYLNRYRINRAVYTLMTNKDISVQKVSEICGYDSICSFNRNFKEFVGCTPRELIKTSN